MATKSVTMSASIPVVIEVVGSINMDLVTRTTRMPVAGETLQANGFSSGRGGKGANQVVACARLLRSEAGGPAKNGVVVKMHGAVGSSDSLGSTEYLEYLEQEGIDTSGVESKDGVPTGTAVIIVEEASGENRILITPGANGKVHPDDVNLDPRPGGFVMFQMEISLETVRNDAFCEDFNLCATVWLTFAHRL
jgi:ribokinase